MPAMTEAAEAFAEAAGVARRVAGRQPQDLVSRSVSAPSIVSPHRIGNGRGLVEGDEQAAAWLCRPAKASVARRLHGTASMRQVRSCAGSTLWIAVAATSNQSAQAASRSHFTSSGQVLVLSCVAVLAVTMPRVSRKVASAQTMIQATSATCRRRGPKRRRCGWRRARCRGSARSRTAPRAATARALGRAPAACPPRPTGRRTAQSLAVHAQSSRPRCRADRGRAREGHRVHRPRCRFLMNRTRRLQGQSAFAKLARTEQDMTAPGPRTLYDKIWDAHVVEQLSGETCVLYVDRHLLDEVHSPQAFDCLRRAGRPVRRPNATLAVVDHNVPTGAGAAASPSRSRGRRSRRSRRTSPNSACPTFPARPAAGHRPCDRAGAGLLVAGADHRERRFACLHAWRAGELAFGVGASVGRAGAGDADAGAGQGPQHEGRSHGWPALRHLGKDLALAMVGLVGRSRRQRPYDRVLW